MAQSKFEVTKGAHPDLITSATDATSLTAGTIATIIFPTGVTRDEAWRALEDCQSRILDGIHTTVFPT